MMMRRVLAAALAGAILIGLLNAFGFCFQKFRFLSNREIVEFAVLNQSARMADFPTNAENPARAYIEAHSGCCSVSREDPFDSSFLENLFGHKVAIVRVQFEMSRRYVDQAPSEGKFYDAYVKVGSCGGIYDVTGMRVPSLGSKN